MLKQFLLSAMVVSLGLITVGKTTAQTFTTLHSFNNNSVGAYPYAGLILSDNTLYGTVSGDGGSGNGSVFAINTNGTGFRIVYSFTNFSDGAVPSAGLILSGNMLYGTTHNGGISNNGVVFTVNTNGAGFTNLHSFTGVYDGANPWGGLILSSNTLYGTAEYGGNFGQGTVFALNINGTSFTNLHNFTGGSDGGYPLADLILAGNNLYGTSSGISGSGAIFTVNTNGAGFTALHSFTVTSNFPPVNSDGAHPQSKLILLGNMLYGTTLQGGSLGDGTMFAISTNGTSFTNLYNLSYTDGANPRAGLILSGNTLYGIAQVGGSSGFGSVFAINTNGTGFMNLYSFADVALPYAGLILSGNTLFGTTFQGGSSGYGSVFSLSFKPQLKIVPSSSNVILSWLTNFAGFDYTGFKLQSAPTTTGIFANITNVVVTYDTNFSVVATNIVDVVSPYTNLVTSGQQFFRLFHP